MKSSEIKEIKILISNNPTVKKDMQAVCLAIIDYISVGPETKSHLNFDDLYRVSPVVDEDIFYDAVFYLTRPPVSVLSQEFEALDPTEGIYIEVPDKQEIIEDMRKEEYYNPHTGDELTLEDFGIQVVTFFKPSERFMGTTSA